MLDTFNAFQFAKQYYRKCKSLKLPSYMHDQLLRASASIGLNLAEGSGKRTLADQRRFYANAYGSVRECQAIIKMEDIKDQELLDLGDKLGAMTYSLSRGMKPR